MKIKLLTLFVGLSIISNAQITSMEVFTTGTKLAFYPNECGNTIPEANGKLTFCDNNNSLGVVERSYGLNDRAVVKMLPNYTNEDEVYLTRNGISIRNTDATWENIPNVALPVFNSQGDWINDTSAQDGLMLPNGNLLFIHTNISQNVLSVYNRTNKIISSLSFNEANVAPRKLIYDSDRDLTWIIAYILGDRFLYSYDGTNMVLVSELNLIEGALIDFNSSSFIYNNNNLYLGLSSGLYRFDVSDYENSNISEQVYNSNSSPALPFDWVRDIQFDSNDDLWLAQTEGGTDGGIVKYDFDTDTFDLYQLENQNNTSVNYTFQSIALNNSGTVWASASNFSGAIKFTLPGDIETWDLQTLEDFSNSGYPMTYSPDNVYFNNNKFYFTTVDFSSSNNENFEVVINDNDVLSGRNDNEDGNLSYWMSSRYTNVIPDSAGGVWWSSNFDNIIIYRDADDNHQTITIDNVGLPLAVDSDDKPIVRCGNPVRLRKIDFPDAIDIQDGNNSATDIKRANEKILVYSSDEQKVDVYQNNALVNTYNLNDDWYDFSYHFAADNNGLLWHFRYVSGLQIKSYNTNGGEITTYDRPENISSLKKVVAAPDGVWFIGILGAIYYQAGTFYSFLAADYDEIYKLEDAVVDSNGKLYLLNIDNASITTIENPTDANPIVGNTSLQTSINNSVLPALEHNKPDALAIDSEGSVWTHASLNAFKLIDTDFATQYISQPTLGTSEIVLDSEVAIYPNPTQGIVHVNSKFQINEIEVYSILGKKVYELKNIQKINLKNLKSGVYFLKISFGKNVITKKVILK